MAEQDVGRNAEVEVQSDEARIGLSDLLDRARFGAERFVITRFGKPTAALVSMKDLERLRELDRSAA